MVKVNQKPTFLYTSFKTEKIFVGIFGIIPLTFEYEVLSYENNEICDIYRAQSETEVFKVLKSGKTKRKGWKRMVTKVTFVGENFTRKPPKFERFIRPMGLRMNKAHVTHPELKATFCLPIIGVKKNPSSPMYTNLGVITKVINFRKIERKCQF